LTPGERFLWLWRRAPHGAFNGRATQPHWEVLSMFKRVLPFIGVAVVISVAIAFVVASMRGSFVRDHLVELKTEFKDAAEKLQGELSAEVKEIKDKVETELPEGAGA
jgi:cell division protein FtsL